MINSLLIYGLTFGIPMLMLSNLDNKYEKTLKIPIIYLIIVALIPSITAGMRYGIGVDYFAYVTRFHTINYVGFLESLNIYNDPLYNLLNIVSMKLFGGPQALFFLSQFIVVIFILIGANNFRKKIPMTMILFIYFMYYYIETFNIVRQAIAMSIIFYSFKYIILNRKFSLYIFWVFIAFLFHKASVIALAYYFIPFDFEKIKKNFLWSIVLIVFMSFGFLTLIFPNLLFQLLSALPIVRDYVSLYQNVDAKMAFWHSILRISPFILPTFLFSKKFLEKNTKNMFFISSAFLAIILTFIFSNIPYGWRLEYYLVLPQLLLVPELTKIYYRLENKIAINIVIVIFYICYFINYYVLMGYGPGFPYQSIL